MFHGRLTSSLSFLACLCSPELNLAKAGLSLDVPMRLHDKATASQGRQSKRHKALIPEFHYFQKLSRFDTLPPNCKRVPPNLGVKIRRRHRRYIKIPHRWPK